jgi:hypothetical protein
LECGNSIAGSAEVGEAGFIGILAGGGVLARLLSWWALAGHWFRTHMLARSIMILVAVQK